MVCLPRPLVENGRLELPYSGRSLLYRRGGWPVKATYAIDPYFPLSILSAGIIIYWSLPASNYSYLREKAQPGRMVGQSLKSLIRIWDICSRRGRFAYIGGSVDSRTRRVGSDQNWEVYSSTTVEGAYARKRTHWRVGSNKKTLLHIRINNSYTDMLLRHSFYFPITRPAIARSHWSPPHIMNHNLLAL